MDQEESTLRKRKGTEVGVEEQTEIRSNAVEAKEPHLGKTSDGVGESFELLAIKS